MYSYESENEYENDDLKEIKLNINFSDDLSIEEQINDFDIFGNKEFNNNDFFITPEDNERRYMITPEKQNENENENKQMSTTANSIKKNIKSCQDKNSKTNEIQETNTYKSDIDKKKSLKNLRRIFNIVKINKKVGRMPKELKGKYEAAHNKYSQDNIIRKIKARVQEIFRNYINYEYSKFMESKGKSKNIILLQRIKPKESRKIRREDNLRWFSTKLKELFSSDLSEKCSLFKPNYNRCQIKGIYKNNEAINVINILEKEVIDVYDLYRKNVRIDGFETLEDDINNLREKMMKKNEDEEIDIEQYLSEYRNIAMTLDKIFAQKKGRKTKSSKKISF